MHVLIRLMGWLGELVDWLSGRGSGIQAVADAADGDDRGLPGQARQVLAQPADMDIQGTGVADEIGLPDFPKKIFAGLDLTGGGHQSLEQGRKSRCQLLSVITQEQRAAVGQQPYSAGLHKRPFGVGAQSLDAIDQLTDGERQDQFLVNQRAEGLASLAAVDDDNRLPVHALIQGFRRVVTVTLLLIGSSCLPRYSSPLNLLDLVLCQGLRIPVLGLINHPE